MKRLMAVTVMGSFVVGLSLPAIADPASTFKEDVPIFGENTCTEPDESISGSAVLHSVVHRHVVNGEERFFIKEHVASLDVEGESGTKYTGSASRKVDAVVDADGTSTIIETFKSRLLSQGPVDNELAIIKTRLTIDASGNVEFEVIDFDVKCVG